MKEELISFAKRNGIDIIGFTTPEPFEEYIEELEKRKAFYLERYAHRIEKWKRFAQPLRVLPQARTLIIIGFYYGAKPKAPPAHGEIAGIVLYGHLGIIQKTRLLCEFLREKGFYAVPGIHRKSSVVRAGLGYYGKHGLVIHKTYGSWVAYQCIATDAELEPDKESIDDACGSCTLCMDACPTSAIYEPGKIDPRRCLSYLLTGRDFPPQFLEKTGKRILGCDLCQEVCPKNRSVPEKNEKESLLPPEFTFPSLKKLLTMDDREYMEVFEYVSVKFINCLLYTSPSPRD